MMYRYLLLFFMGVTACLVNADITGQPVAGKMTVPVTGALSADDLDPELEQHIYLYFNVTAQEDMAELTLEFKLPVDVEPLEGHPTRATFGDLKAGQTVTLALPVENMSLEPQQVFGSAIMIDTDAFYLSKPFMVILNDPDPRRAFAPETSTVQEVGGQRVRVFSVSSDDDAEQSDDAEQANETAQDIADANTPAAEEE